MDIIFYKITDDPAAVNKSLAGGVTLAIKARKDLDFYNPAFLVQNYDPGYNYFAFDGKYYFIRAYEYVDKNIYKVRGHVDVLMTYKQEILQSTATLVNGTGADGYLSVYNRNYDVRRNVTKINMDNNFDTEGTNIVIGVNGQI